MLLQEAIVAHLKGDSALDALIADRIHPNVIPEDWTLPALTYQRVGGEEQISHAGVRTWFRSRIQFTAQGETYASAAGVIDAVKTALRGYRGTMGGGVQVHGVFLENDLDSFGDEADRSTVRVDAIFIHKDG
jgi:hypothetical protein